MSEGREKQIQRFFDGELGAEELSDFDQVSAEDELRNLAFLREGVRDWYGTQAKEIEKSYRPGFAARHVLAQAESNKSKGRSPWKIFSPIPMALAGGFAVLALMFILPGRGQEDFQSKQIAKNATQPEAFEVASSTLDIESKNQQTSARAVSLGDLPAIQPRPDGLKVSNEVRGGQLFQESSRSVNVGSTETVSLSKNKKTARSLQFRSSLVRPKSIEWIKSSKKYTFVSLPNAKQKEMPVIWVSSQNK